MSIVIIIIGKKYGFGDVFWIFLRLKLGQTEEIRLNRIQKTLFYSYMAGWMFFNFTLLSYIGTTMVTKERREINNVEELQLDPEIKVMVISDSSMEEYFVGPEAPFKSIMSVRGFGKFYSERDDFIGLFQLGNRHYQKTFMNGELVIIGIDI